MKIIRSESADNYPVKKLFSFFRSGDNKEITKSYDLYRKTFIPFVMNNFHIDETIAADIYQESFLAIYRLVKDGKLSDLSVSLKTYLFQIGRNLSLKHIRDRKEHEDIENIPDMEEDSDLWNQQQEIAYQMVLDMGEPCNRVLSLYYWQRKSMQEIAREMNYKNEQVAKNKKHSCFRSLKEKLLSKLKEEDLI